ncbi:hypothetical protein JXB31_00710 [Candidatus Woesearchaeota archaeon]|nr:hypothetical protein [Candidatus Woesearchaeota archaeon]
MANESKMANKPQRLNIIYINREEEKNRIMKGFLTEFLSQRYEGGRIYTAQTLDDALEQARNNDRQLRFNLTVIGDEIRRNDYFDRMNKNQIDSESSLIGLDHSNSIVVNPWEIRLNMSGYSDNFLCYGFKQPNDDFTRDILYHSTKNLLYIMATEKWPRDKAFVHELEQILK